MTEILVVDDDFAIQRMVRMTLEKEGYAVRSADNAEAALVELGKKAPDLMVLDVRMPGMSGFDLCRKLREDAAFKRLPIIFLTSKGEEPHRVTGLEIGGDDYIIKPFSAPEFLARIKTVLRRAGADPLSSETLRSGPLTVDIAERRATVDGRTLRLTTKEFDLLGLFLRKKRRVLGRALITEEVWGKEFTGATRTVDTHISVLRRKLGPLGTCLQTVENAGYRWTGSPDL
jgi:two-component system, OmpR family, phosphate regulon response regulator PhoB